MTTKQYNKNKMFGTVGVVLHNYSEKIQTIPAFPPKVTRYNNYVSAISLKAGEQTSAPAGKVEARDKAKAALAKSLYVVMKGIKLLGQKNNDNELISVCTYSLSEVEIMKDLDLRNKTNSILEKTAATKEALAEFGITEEKLTALANNQKTFSDAMDDLTGGETGKIAATTSLVNLFKETDAVLKSIDDLADILDDTCPEFGLEYWAARNIKDLGGSHKEDDKSAAAGTPAVTN
jgi:hypothetical protein